MTVRDMKELVERLGEIREQVKDLTTEKDTLTSELKEELLKKGYGYEVESDHYIASLSPTKILEINENKLWGTVSPEIYRRCCKVQVTQSRKVLSLEVLEQVSIEKKGDDKLNLKSK